MQALVAVLTLLLAATILALPTRALEIEFSGRTVRRDILALFDSRRERLPHETRIHKFAEMPLGHLGYRLVYRDVNGPLPDAAELGRFRGVLTWFVEPLRRPEVVVQWLDGATAAGLKLVILGEVAPPDSDWTMPAINRVLARLGLEHTGDYVDLTWRAKVGEMNAEMIGFERPLDKALPGFAVIRARGQGAESHLVIDVPSSAGKVSATVVATGSGGGYASHNYTIFYEPNTDRVLWTLNPFAFFKEAFGAERFPVPDTTTLAGRRIYFSHIDGDGWNNLSEIEGHREVQRLSAEVIAREAIIPYPDLPVTVGIIAGDVQLELGGNPAGRTVARQLFALPQVEVASHTYTHPYNWRFFENYDRTAEMTKVEQYQPPDLTPRERLSRGVLRLANKELPADRYDRFVAGTDDLPRTYLRKPFDLDLEVAGALRLTESLAPAGKKAKAYLWSGDTTPFEGAIRAVRAAGARNINGGDSRFDREFPSVAYVPPISRIAGAERQIYAANSNENTYTNDWTGPYYGFFMLEHTLRNTEAPRRLKPFNLYYHMYSGEKEAALASVKHFLDLARASPVIPVTASRYAGIADDFFRTEIEQVDLFSWAVFNRGGLQTVRFDAAEGLMLDIARSKGVLGANRHAGSLYVALDAAHERAIVTLRAAPTSAAAPDGAGTLRLAQLVESRWEISDLRRGACGFEATAQGYGPGEMVWQHPSARGLRVSATGPGGTVSVAAASTDAAGLVRIKINTSAIEPVQIRADCHD